MAGWPNTLTPGVHGVKGQGGNSDHSSQSTGVRGGVDERAQTADEPNAEGGLTWSSPMEGLMFDIGLLLPSADELLLPFNLYPLPQGDLTGHYQICPRDRKEIKLVKGGMTISGWPRPVGWGGPGDERSKRLGLSPWVFEGQAVQLKNGAYLATIYGDFQGDEVSSVAAAERGMAFTGRSGRLSPIPRVASHSKRETDPVSRACVASRTAA